MSAATTPVALVEAVETGRVQAGSLILMPAFGGGLTLSSHLIRWGQRTTPLQECTAELPPCTQTALDIVNAIRAQKRVGEETVERFGTLSFAEQRG
jgi:3-oxoacyl-[acyl-carrier-protein] synthase III